jgi:hypothetical protein
MQPVLPSRYTSGASTQRSVCTEAISNSSSLIGDQVGPLGVWLICTDGMRRHEASLAIIIFRWVPVRMSRTA